MSRDVQVIRHGACPMQLTNKRRIMSVVEIVYKKSLEHYALINTGDLFFTNVFAINLRTILCIN